MSDFIPPYRLPVLSHYNEDMNRRWEVCFWVWNQNLNNGKGKLQRKQKRIPVRLNKTDRYSFAQRYIADITRALMLGKHIRLKSETQEQPEQEEYTKQDISIVEAYEKILLVKKSLLKANSFKDYRNEVNRFIDYLEKFNYNETLLNEWTKEQCIEYLDHYQVEKGVSNRTRNNTLTILKSMANDLMERGYLDANPWHKIKKERAIVAQNYPYTQHHKNILFPKLQRDPQLWYACQFLYYLFRRVGELENMKVGQIKWEQKLVMIPNTFKSGEAKYPIISTAFEKVILEMGILKMNPDWYIFGRNGEPGPLKLKSGNLTIRFTKIRRKLGISDKYTFYCWKHTGNLDAVLAGVNIKAIQQQNGHAKIEDTDKYLRSLGVEHNQQIRERQPSIHSVFQASV